MQRNKQQSVYSTCFIIHTPAAATFIFQESNLHKIFSYCCIFFQANSSHCLHHPIVQIFLFFVTNNIAKMLWWKILILLFGIFYFSPCNGIAGNCLYAGTPLGTLDCITSADGGSKACYTANGLCRPVQVLFRGALGLQVHSKAGRC
jgi:hypothetical protein